MKIGVTGHRPSKIGWGYDLSNTNWMELQSYFITILSENACEEAITGMALGVDTVFALAVCRMKEAGYNIKLHCAIPFVGQENRWNDHDKEMYRSILEVADKVVIVSDGGYSAYKMQARNEYIVDNVDKLIAVWNGSCGGTKNCIDYATKRGLQIVTINV